MFSICELAPRRFRTSQSRGMSQTEQDDAWRRHVISKSETNRPVLVTMLGVVALTSSVVVVSAQPNEPGGVAIESSTEYRILATNRTSTM